MGDAPGWAPAGGLGAGGGYGGERDVGEAGRRWWAMGCCCLAPAPRIGVPCPQEAYESAVEYFGENPKTSPPTTFFPMFMRFIRAYKVGGDGGGLFLGAGRGSGVRGGLTPLWRNWEEPGMRLGACGAERLRVRGCSSGRLQVLELGWGELGAVVCVCVGVWSCSRTPRLSTPSPRLSQESRAGHRAVEETRGRSQRGGIQPPWQRGAA